VEEIGRSYANGSEGLEYAGRVEEAIALAEEGIAAAPHWGLHDFVVYLTSSLASWKLRRGEFDEVVRLCEEAMPRGHTAAAPRHHTVGRLALARGDFAQAESELERAEELARGLGGPEWWPAILADLGRLRLGQGRLDDAEEILRRALEAVKEPQYAPWLPDFADVYPMAARVAADRAENDRAHGEDAAAAAAAALAALDAMLARIPGERRPPRPAACLALTAAEVTRAAGRPDPEAWRLAAVRFRALSEPYTVAYAQFREAEALLAAGRGDEARALIEDAHAVTGALGERPLRAELEALARRARVPLKGPQSR
jgi:tetratricopeptide (TPR) repeat protein